MNRQSAIKRLAIVAGCIALVLLIAVVIIASTGSGTITDGDMSRFAESTNKLPLMLAPLRWAMYALVIWRWEHIVGWLAKRRPEQWPKESIGAAVALRPRIALMAILIEIFMNLPVLPTIIAWARS